MFNNNSSTAAEFFKGKQKYDETYPAFPKKKVYDIWYARPYYGKIDTLGTIVYPQEKFLKVVNVKQNLKAINFVADAFLELKNYIERAKNKKAYPVSFLQKFTVKKAWQPVPQLYDEYFEGFIFNPFLNGYLLGKKIKTFKCFVKEYLKFVKRFSSDLSFTLNEFILSNNCTNKISGLILDLSNDSHDDDKKKVEDYVDEFIYTSFVSSCKSFGFRVNKNAPWQIIADLSSYKMKRLAINYNLDLTDNSLFDQYYYTATEIDYWNFKFYLWQMYASYYAVNTTYSITDVKLKGVNNNSPMFSNYDTAVIDELPVQLATEKKLFLSKYGEIFFLSLYLKVRLIENDAEVKFKEFNKRMREYYELGIATSAPWPNAWNWSTGQPGEGAPSAQAAGIKFSLDYIDKKLINSEIYKTKKLNPYYFNT